MRTFDRQYLASAAISTAAALVFLALLAAFVALLGWIALALLAAAFGSFFAWFYLGPRPDLAPKAGPSPDAGERP